MAREQPSSSEGLGHSLTDLMTSIAVIFILLFLAFLRNEQQEIAHRKGKTETNREQLLNQLKRQLREDVVVREDPDDPLTLEIVLRDDPELLTFAYNKARVRPQGKVFLREFIPQLSDIVC